MTLILVLALVGVGAIVAELFVPGGVVGIAGGVALLTSVGLTFAEFGMAAGTGYFVLLLVFLLAFFRVWMKKFDSLPITRLLVLRKELAESSHHSHEEMGDFVGQAATALTPLAPSGKVEIADQVMNARLANGTAEKGETVKVIRVEGGFVTVELADGT